MLYHNPKNKEKNILNSQNINPIIEDREENYKKKNNFDIYYPLNYQNKNSDDENKKINITNNNKKYQNKSLDTSKTFLSTNKYWERRNKENEIKMEKIRKEEEYKKLKELQNKPNISFKSKKITTEKRKIFIPYLSFQHKHLFFLVSYSLPLKTYIN